MEDKEGLKNHYIAHGKTDTWYQLALKYNIKPEGTPEQRAKAANDICRRMSKKETLEVPSKNPTYIYKDTYTITEKPKTEVEEFLQWKRSKEKQNKQVGMHVVVGCMHLPAINPELFYAFVQFLRDYRKDIKGLHLIGDILDCKSLSAHDAGNISDTTLDAEYEKANLYLDVIDATLPSNIEKNYLWGNHEDRYTRALKKVDLAKFGKALLSPTKGCFFEERGYTVQEDYKNASIQLGKHLDLIHGEYVTQNSTKKHLDVYKKSIMFAHTHKMGIHMDADKGSFNIGWMGDSSNTAFNYASKITKNQWQNGFAIVHIDHDGFYHVELIHWYNNRSFYGGKEYK